MDKERAFKSSLRCWSRLVDKIEMLPDSDEKQYELDKIFEAVWLRSEVYL